MNQRLKELMLEAGYAAPELADRANKLANLIVQECILAVENTNRHHVHTSFDSNLVETTISKTKESIRKHFDLK